MDFRLRSCLYRWHSREKVDGQRLVEDLAKLDYPGFAYVRTRVRSKNPGEVLLTALAQENLEGRAAEALPWLLLRYWRHGSDLAGGGGEEV